MCNDFKQVLRQENFNFSKRFGQNFIFDTNLLAAIASDAGIATDETVVEVGTGAGTLTAELCKRAEKVISFEIDDGLKRVHEKTLGGIDNLEIIYGDVLDFNLQEIGELTKGKKYRLVANLPYYITTPVIFHFLEDVNLVSLTVMVQKEVADRLCALPDTPEYGAVTAQVAALGTAACTRNVGRNMFTPPPNVDSAVVRVDINPKSVADYPHLKKLIAAAFAMRRKTLINNLMSSFGLSRALCEKALCAVGINEKARGETLSVEDFIRLSDFLTKK